MDDTNPKTRTVRREMARSILVAASKSSLGPRLVGATTLVKAALSCQYSPCPVPGVTSSRLRLMEGGRSTFDGSVQLAWNGTVFEIVVEKLRRQSGIAQKSCIVVLRAHSRVSV